MALFGDDDVAERADVVTEVVADLLIDGLGVVLECQEQTLRLVRFEGSGVFAYVADLTSCQKLSGVGDHIGGMGLVYDEGARIGKGGRGARRCGARSDAGGRTGTDHQR